MFPPHEPSPQLSPELQDAERRFHEQLAADPERALAEYQERFGNVIDRDNARELFPDYAWNRESRQALGPATYRPAGMLTDELFRRAVAESDPTDNNLVMFNAGGPGVGKSTGTQAFLPYAQFVMDGTLSNYEKSNANIQVALTNGKKVLVLFTYRPFEETVQNIIDRAADPDNGRVVSTPMAAQGRIQALENVLRLAEERAGDPNFTVRAVDNTGDGGKPMPLNKVRAQKPEDLDDLRRRAQAYVNAHFRDNAASNPALTEALRRRILGKDAGPDGRRDSGAGGG